MNNTFRNLIFVIVRLSGSQKSYSALCSYDHIGSFTFNECTANVQGKRFVFGRHLVM
jgi:hypothetical protein